jgi:hypothetical protein
MSQIAQMAKLRIVVLKSPFQIWTQYEDPVFQKLFTEMVGLKIRGYGAEYPEGVLAVDTSDFIATHLLVCQEGREGLRPIMGFKTTSLADCEKHRVAFPALGLVQAAEAKPHIEVMKGIIARCLKEGKQLSYTGSWTIEPHLRKNKELSRELVKLFKTTYVFHHLEQKVDEIITGGTMRFKADTLLGDMGHDPLAGPAGMLEPIQVRHLFQENVRVLHLKKFSALAKETVEPYRSMWEDRLEISCESIELVHGSLRKAG